ncbi:hypothetical protein [Pedobacter sp. N23S346]|uniref:hypothetical protein n=1 Tax=Pedobacter sp. N23S346 TaxID=3402750 RepID=UPI003AD6F8E2
MIPEKLRKLIELLLSRTIAKTAIWTKGSAENQFKLSVSEGMAITITFWHADAREPDMFVIIVYNVNGDPIETFNTFQDESSPQDFELLRQLYKAASDQYYKVEETMDALIAYLNGQEIIGEAEKTPNNDDLPF